MEFTASERRFCEDILAEFSPTDPLIVNPALYQIMKDAGFPMESVIEQTLLPFFG